MSAIHRPRVHALLLRHVRRCVVAGCVGVWFALSVLLATGLSAQVRDVRGGTTSDPRVDSASAARRAFREAQAAPTRQQAALLLRRATAAWPAQPAYWLARARNAVAMNDTASVDAAISALVRMQQSPALMQDTLLHRWTLQHADRSLAPRVARDAESRHKSVIHAVVDSNVFVEGAAISRTTGALFVTSLRDGTILQCASTGRWRDLHVSRDERIDAVFAVRVAQDDTTLWITTAPHVLHRRMASRRAEGRERAAIVRVRVSDGAVLEWHALPEPTSEHVPGDLLVLPRGDILVSDSQTARVYLWRASDDTWTTLIHPGFRSPQGMALLPDGNRVIIADYSHGLYLLAVDALDVRPVADATGTSVLGLDGLAWHGQQLIAVQNGGAVPQIIAVPLNAAATAVHDVRVVDRQPDVAPAPTSVVSAVGGVLYVGNSPWSLFDASGERTSDGTLTPTPVLMIPDRGLAPARGSRSVATTPSRPERAQPSRVAVASCSRSSARDP